MYATSEFAIRDEKPNLYPFKGPKKGQNWSKITSYHLTSLRINRMQHWFLLNCYENISLTYSNRKHCKWAARFLLAESIGAKKGVHLMIFTQHVMIILLIGTHYSICHYEIG